MRSDIFADADEVATLMKISKTHAYRLIRGLNDELKKQGYITIAGRVPREYLAKHIYGYPVSVMLERGNER